MASSLFIIILGMLVPVLAAAPFYLADRRNEQWLEAEAASLVGSDVDAVIANDVSVETVGDEGSLENSEDGEVQNAASAESGSAAWRLLRAREAVEDGALPKLPRARAEMQSGEAATQAECLLSRRSTWPALSCVPADPAMSPSCSRR